MTYRQTCLGPNMLGVSPLVEQSFAAFRGNTARAIVTALDSSPDGERLL